MNSLKIVAVAALVLVPFAAAPLPALAATAHNSQLGGDGPMSNASAPAGITARTKQMQRRKAH